MSSFFGLLSPTPPKSFRWSDKIDLPPSSYLNTTVYYCFDETGKRVGVASLSSIDHLFEAIAYKGTHSIKECLGSFETVEHAKAAVEKELAR